MDLFIRRASHDNRLTMLVHAPLIPTIWHWLNAALAENMVLTWGTLKGLWTRGCCYN